MVSINPGDLNQKIQFYNIIRTKNTSGGHTKVDDLAFETFSKITPMKARQSIEGGKLINIQPYMVKIRHSADHTPVSDMIVKYRNDTYLINSIDPTDIHRGFWNLIISKE